MADEPAGQRIARARRRRGMSQAVLAGLIGRSESWLSQVERGRRGIDSHVVLTRLADVLRIDIEELSPPSTQGSSNSRFDPTPLIEQAMMNYGVHENGKTHVSLDHLETMTRSVYRDYQATMYETAGRRLPELIMLADAATRLATPGDAAVSAVRALVYDTVAAVLNRVGEATLAWAAAERAVTAADHSGKPVLTAAGAWRLSYVITSREHPGAACDLAINSADTFAATLKSPSPEELSVYGALHLSAATAAATAGDQQSAREFLAKARSIAERTGEGNHHGTAFGPANVAIHTISVSMALGDARTAMITGEDLELGALPAGLVGRRAQVQLDLARAYTVHRKDAAAVNVLLAAERLSPQLVRYNPGTRDVLSVLLRREHRPSTPELRPLARRAGVI